MLKCETNNSDIEFDIQQEAEIKLHMHNTTTQFEHGQWFVTCLDCGLSWSVNDAENNWGFYYQFDCLSTSDDKICE
jgi:hypothetical protein